MTKLYDINYLKEQDTSTTQAPFESVDDILAKNGVHQNNSTQLGLGNTNKNIGNRNSIKQRLQNKILQLKPQDSSVMYFKTLP